MMIKYNPICTAKVAKAERSTKYIYIYFYFRGVFYLQLS